MRRGTKRRILIALLLVLAIGLGMGSGVLAVSLLGGETPFQKNAPVSQSASASLPQSGSVAASQVSPPVMTDYTPVPLPEEMRAMWISFIELKQMDFSSAQAFEASIGPVFANCKQMGINTVIVSVRPFGDALYPSAYYPFSHIMTETQGQDPGFDPLDILVQAAHSQQLRLEAWVNPYRIQHPTNGPAQLSADNPASQNPALARSINGEMWYEPSNPQVEQLVVDGVAEILQNYPVDGIHFDDYFYPTGIDESFDAEGYAADSRGLSLADWRRDNVNRMVTRVYQTVKSISPQASFGISMQGNNENNYTTMYADVKKWMANAGFVDYVMPQLYWGFHYLTQSGRDSYAFNNITAEWAFYPRIDSVRLFAGLGAYRIGLYQGEEPRKEFGDGGNNPQDEWQSGHNLADMVTQLRTVDGFSGFALFRYEYLFQPEDPLSTSEREALTALLQA